MVLKMTMPIALVTEEILNLLCSLNSLLWFVLVYCPVLKTTLAAAVMTKEILDEVLLTLISFAILHVTTTAYILPSYMMLNDEEDVSEFNFFTSFLVSDLNLDGILTDMGNKKELRLEDIDGVVNNEEMVMISGLLDDDMVMVDEENREASTIRLAKESYEGSVRKRKKRVIAVVVIIPGLMMIPVSSRMTKTKMTKTTEMEMMKIKMKMTKTMEMKMVSSRMTKTKMTKMTEMKMTKMFPLTTSDGCFSTITLLSFLIVFILKNRLDSSATLDDFSDVIPKQSSVLNFLAFEDQRFLMPSFLFLFVTADRCLPLTSISFLIVLFVKGIK